MRRLLALTLLFALVPSAARAAWQAPQPIDGPNGLVVGLGGVSVARDGGGAAAYIRRDGVFVSRLAGGAFGGPEPVAPTATATEAAVAAGDGNRLLVAWIDGGSVFAAVAPGGLAPGPFSAPQPLGGPGATGLSVDMGLNGVGYAIWQQGGDVHAARLVDTTWSAIPAPLDIQPAMEAGTGRLRPRIAVSAEGYALATWGEQGSDGRTHVYARRLIGSAPSAYPQDATPAGGAADSPDVSVQWDGSFAWVVFRQDVGGVSHTIGRRFLGSQFEAPVVLDGGTPSDSPRVSVNGGGDGAAIVQGAGNTVLSPVLDHDAFGPPVRMDGGSAGPAGPVVSATDDDDIAAAWRVQAPDGTWQAHGRFQEAHTAYGPDTVLSRPDLGSVADPGVALSGDRVGDYAVAMVQGPDGARTLSVTVFDRPPGRPSVPTSTAYARRARPSLRWGAGLDLWGPQTFRVLIDGRLSGQTQAETFVPPKALKTGRHTFRVDAVDRAGQVTGSHTRTIRVDATAPRLSVRVTGARRAGHALTVAVKARDAASGLARVTVAYGDGRSTRLSTSRHAYRRGRYTLTVTAVDKAGNLARRSVKLRIR